MAEDALDPARSATTRYLPRLPAGSAIRCASLRHARHRDATGRVLIDVTPRRRRAMARRS